MRGVDLDFYPAHRIAHEEIMKHMGKFGIGLLLIVAGCGEGTSPGGSDALKARAKTRIHADAGSVSQATNDFYTVFVNQIPAPGFGQYTVMTGPSHPVTLSTGAPQNVLFGGGDPGTSYNTIRSYTTGAIYAANVNFVTSPPLYILDPSRPGITGTTTPLGTTGFRTTFVLSGPPNTPDALTIVQDVNVHGTTFLTSTVEVTTTITNNGSAPVALGLRYLWDTQIGIDDGPTFQAQSPNGPVLTTEQTYVSPTFGFYRIQDNDKNVPTPLFSVFGTVTEPTTITPAPTPPDQLENAYWGTSFYAPFAYTTTPNADISTSTSPNDNAVLYYWGPTQANAINLAPGASRTFSQSLVSAAANAPPPFNQSPVAHITAPTNNAAFAQGSAVSFAGTGTDPEDGTLTGASLVWTDNVAGQIGTGTSFSLSSLAVGTHVVTLTATDSQGAKGTATVTIVITGVEANQPPTAHITSPATGALLAQGSSIAFAGTGSDPEDGVLTGSSLVWTDNVSGQIGTGTSFSLATLAAGVHVITLTATDSKGLHGTATVTITIGFSETIGTAGGSLCVASCGLALYFPPNALSAPVTFFVWTVPAPTPLPGIIGQAYVIAPVVSLAATGELGIHYDPATLPSGVSESGLRLYQFLGGSWHLVPNGAVNLTSHFVYADVTSTGVFAVVGTP
jgi:hypothetical protein